MNNVHQAFAEALVSFLTARPVQPRRDHAAFTTYLDAANGLAWSLEAGEIKPHQRPSIDRRGALWWVTHLEGGR